MDRIGFFACVLALPWIVAAGCVGGQSGTETGGKIVDDPLNPAGIKVAPNSCACALSDAPAIALRGSVVRVEQGHVRVRVRALLGEGSVEPRLRVAVGDEIGGELSAGCEPAELQPGEDVAVLHAPGAQDQLECPEYRSCMSRRCDQLLAGDVRLASCEPGCQRETRAQCTTHAGDALLSGRLVVARWGRELSLPLGGVSGEPLRVPAAALSDLLYRGRCESRVMRALPDGGAPFEPEPGFEDISADPERGSAAE